MTPHRKANHDSHSCFSPVLGRTAARRLRDDHRLKSGSSSRGIVTDFCLQNDGVGHLLFRNETAPRRCASALQVRSIVLRCVGVASWEPNQQGDGRRCLGERFEQLFEETSGPNDCRNSVASAASFGGTRSPMSSWLSASAARSARRNSTSRAIASLPMKRSWSCSTNCARASGHDSSCGGVEGHARQCGPADTVNASNVVVNRMTDAPLGAGNAQGAGIEPGPQDNSQAKEPEANAGSAVATSGRLAMGSSRPVTGRSVTATSENGRDRAERRSPSFSCAETTSGIGSARGTSAMLHPGVVDGPTTLALQAGTVVTAGETAPNSSSGDGLGIHQPRSMTRGTRAKVKTPSGRARDRAMCPAVARFVDRRAA